MAKRIVLTGGGTGGHLFPLTTVAKKIREIHGGEEKIDFLFVGPVGELEKEVMDANQISQKNIKCGKLRRYASAQYITDLLKIPIGFIQALWHLLWYMPDAVFAKGGFASVPVVSAARLYGIPVLIHESDAIPGLANKFLGSISNKIAITFERARMYFPSPRTITTGNPVRMEVVNGDRQRGRDTLNLHKEFKPTVFFVGGSQGAKIINDRVLEYLDELLEKYQVIHQTGKSHYNHAVREAQRKGYKIEHSDYFPMAFLKDELKDVLALADVVVSRAGSTAISELAANRKASILVPIKESANDHQRINAFEVSKAGGAIVLEEDNFKKNILMHKIDELIENPKIREKVEAGIAKFYHPDATEQIAKEIISLLK
ncbi:MAG: undecaprenyldiphospho-muramoylpentapeptide beta-N-acetylglucosaminyltransferase [Patescibacteria group bacterium]|nr:undecaprenyldiphospho-muramoylpentapeptide beta-N-acetylglucosaminyltransferase [Patescibacteria group bacterium]